MVFIDLLDIGQGDAILIRAGGKTALVDSGDRGRDTVEQLRRLGVERLDLVVATHPHADHIGTMHEVVQSFEVGLFLDNGLPHTTATYERMMRAVEEQQVPYRTARAGMRLNLGDEAALHVLFPTEQPIRGTRSDLNSNSVVLWLEHGEVDVLLTGDAEAPTERALLRQGIGPIEVLKVAHHGGDHSSTASFLDALEPQVALISVGASNRYGHPGEETLERLGDRGVPVYRTDLSGHIRVLSDRRSFEVFEGSLEELGATFPLPSLDASPPEPPDEEPEISRREQRKIERQQRRDARRAAREEDG